MKGKGLPNGNSFVELRVKYYMQSLIVETPEQVLHYLEKRIKTYRCRLEKSEKYPRTVIINIQRLINEYTSDMIWVKKYINAKKKGRLKNITNHQKEASKK